MRNNTSKEKGLKEKILSLKLKGYSFRQIQKKLKWFMQKMTDLEFSSGKWMPELQSNLAEIYLGCPRHPENRPC